MSKDPIDTPEQILKGIDIDDIFDCPGGHKLDEYDVKQALAALDRYYKAQMEQVLREVIGEDVPVPSSYRSSGKTSAFVGNVIRAEQRQRAEELGYELKEVK